MTTEQKNEIREFVQTLEDKPFEKHTIGDIARLRASCKRLIKALETAEVDLSEALCERLAVMLERDDFHQRAEAAEARAVAMERALRMWCVCDSCIHTNIHPNQLPYKSCVKSFSGEFKLWCFDIERFSEAKDNG